ncbi:hypothetical protein NCCP1664_02280 [Zafaria cholistanensis]|uniref:Heparan-alpha-glucosaminide N-acetyltransferase catalytic domain-containing protein n=1 Tax=Zafaria cholistanensis TaxID=1682741 RepID=A0A5A7NPP6_9MICC|nr:heparan-alpha-glucosaminide N-acetyltransferase domain-containing protein [Zafaria cholistanensis]GER21731.1 hypothetical protein NCCP1664_02280 [Zafaria cholistanensis]
MTKPAGKRLKGVDVARGVALLGMMAIHLVPAWTEESGTSPVWTLLAGRAAALFALLAGVSLTFTSGGAGLLSGQALAGARAALAVRALAVGAIGLGVAYLDPPAAIILGYYGAMFLLAVPLLGLGPRTLALAALGFAVLGPLLMQEVRDWLPDLDGYDPTLTDLVARPGTVAAVLLFTGSYPAVPWMAYICAGLAVGRLDLRSRAIQVRLVAGGVLLAAAGWLASLLMMGPLGGRERILAATPGLKAAELEELLVYGPDFGLPTTTHWWLAVLAPYSTTPPEIIATTGTALAALGGLLLLSRAGGAVLAPLAVMGGMTLTLYTGHLVLLSTGLLLRHPWAALAVHVAGALLFALIWRNVTEGRPGPLEGLVSLAAKRTGAWIGPAATRGRRTAARTGPG